MCFSVCNSVLQRVLQCMAVRCSALMCYGCVAEVCCSVLQYVAACCSMLQRVAVCCSVLQYVAACEMCNDSRLNIMSYCVLQCVAVSCSEFCSVLKCVKCGVVLGLIQGGQDP